MKTRSLLVVVFLIAATTLFGQVDPASYDPDDQPHPAADLDSVSPYNGQLSLTVPIGQSYSVGPELSFQVQLHYSSRVWAPGQWVDFNNTSAPEPYMVLDGDPAFGLGWRFSLGRIVESDPCLPPIRPAAYVAPDGSSHQLYDRREYCDPRTACPPLDGFYYTRDGTYLRVKALGAGAGYKMWFQNGNSTTFDHVVSCFDDRPGYLQRDYGRGRDGWYPTTIANAHGDAITVTYQANETQPCTRCVAISPRTTYEWVPKTITIPSIGATTSRQITVNFDSNLGLVTGFSVPTFNNGTATYTLVHDAPGALHFPLRRPLSGHPTVYTTNASGFVAPPHFLDRIDLPNSATTGRYLFTYLDQTETIQSQYARGSLASQKIPTGATISYQYGTWTFYHSNALNRPTNCSFPPSQPSPLRSNLVTGPGIEPTLGSLWDCAAPDRAAGIVRRDVDFNGAETRYFQYSFPYGEARILSPSQPPTLDQLAQTETLVVSPKDDAGKQHTIALVFSASDEKGVSGSLVGALLREKTFAGDVSSATIAQTAVCPASSFCVSKAERAVAFLWETDSIDPTRAPVEANRRIKRNTTFFHGLSSDRLDPLPGDRYHRVDYQYDKNAGEYSNETHSGNLGQTPSGETVASDSRDEQISWLPLIDSTHWRLLLASRVELRQNAGGPVFSTVVNTFDTARGDLSTGVLLSTKTLDGNGYGSLEMSFDRDTHGYVSKETRKLTAASFTSTYIRTLTFASGALQSAQWSGVGWKSVDNTIDPTTGFLVESRDPNGLKTSFTYDSLGRPLDAIPPGGDVPMHFAYDSPTQTTVQNTAGGKEYRWSQTLADPLGRIAKELRKMPGAVTAKRLNAYDKVGHRTFESEWADATVADGLIKGTTWSVFDDFDRPGRITRADQTTTSIQYDDGSAVKASAWMASVTIDNVGGQPSKTVYRHDAFGRLIRVTEPTSGTGDDTTYSYDRQDRLTQVSQGQQTRSFVYDAFGFLRNAKVPERNNLQVTYLLYDALGNLVSESLPGNTSEFRHFDYDTAGRLRAATAAGRQYVANSYDGDGGSSCVLPSPDGCPTGGSYKLGRLTRQVGYNPTSTPAVTVTQDLFYSDRAGRLSSRVTRLKEGSATFLTDAPLVESWVYDPIGLLAQYSYPRPGGNFTVATSYDHGLPIAVRANGLPIVSSASYQPSGLLASYVTANLAGIAGSGTNTIVEPDPNGIARPSRIHSLIFDTGQYAYDGAGNVTAMGADCFGYDAASRLTSAKFGSCLTPTSQQSFSYDRYGNLLGSGGANARTLSIDTATNRLASVTTNQKWTTLYDDQGNLKSLTAGAFVETFNYDDQNRLAGYTPASGGKWNYGYDARGERVLKVAPAVTSRAGYLWTFRDHMGRIASEYLGSAPIRDNVYLGDLLVASFAACPAPGWAFYSSDHLGSPRQVVDPNGQLLDVRKYWPYGDEASVLDANTPQRLRFAQMERDTEATRYYDHARSLGIDLGRFLSFDQGPAAATHPQSWNRYAYALSNPLTIVDRSGLAPDSFSPEYSYFDPATGAPLTFNFEVGTGSSSPEGKTDEEVVCFCQMSDRALAVYAGFRMARPVVNFTAYALAAEASLASGAFIAQRAAWLIWLSRATTRTAIMRATGVYGELSAGVYGAKKAIESLSGTASRRFPDLLDAGRRMIGEVKNVAKLDLSGRVGDQLMDFYDWARAYGYQFNLYVRPTTEIGAQLMQRLELEAEFQVIYLTTSSQFLEKFLH